MNIGFIGLGGIAGNYLNSLDRIDGTRVSAVCDINPDRADAAKKRFNANAYADHRRMLDNEALDALFVCIPPFAHTDQEIIAAEKGVHLFIAKPVGLSFDNSLRVLEAVKKAGVITNVGYMWRHSDLTDKAEEIIRGRKIALAVGTTHVGTPGTAWWRVYDQSGGQIVEQATHVYDAARYFCGDAARVHAWGGSELNPAIDFEDSATVNILFQNGSCGNISNTSISAGGGGYTLRLIGGGFNLDLNYGANHMSGHADGEAIQFGAQESGYYIQVERFVRAVRDGETDLIRSDYEDGLKSLALTLAANESLRTGEIAEVPNAAPQG